MLEKLATEWPVFYESLDRLTNPSDLYYQRTVFDDEVFEYLKNNSAPLLLPDDDESEDKDHVPLCKHLRRPRLAGGAAYGRPQAPRSSRWMGSRRGWHARGTETPAKLGKSDVKAPTIASALHAACLFAL